MPYPSLPGDTTMCGLKLFSQNLIDQKIKTPSLSAMGIADTDAYMQRLHNKSTELLMRKLDVIVI